ncbi:SEN1 N terminal-domain-containing protein [Irpex rosettiformis]|uniref:SEN1 N terminal-domain-containing protein n=1 Tax=Irpex rosettiformis TaxID=378272 RepID=A0ACB8TWU9_9APHY|nr:SEN1 N terminal-domain-containing protein [Irpex rosettiformis]
MSGGGSSAELDRLRARLAHYRDHPTDTTGVPDQDLADFHKYLLKPEIASNITLHWFCSSAEPVTKEAAIFLLRLHAYNGGRVTEWRKHLHRCLAGCSECVRGLQENRLSSLHTYFGAFAENTLKRFYKTFDDELVRLIVETCESAQLRPGQPSTNGKTLADIPAPVFYLMLSNPTIVTNAKVIGLLRAHIPSAPVAGWPNDSPAAGLLLLLMEKTPEVRSWAALQANACTRGPMPRERFTAVHSKVLEMTMHAILPPTSSLESSFFSDDLSALWQGYSTILRFVPEEWLYPSKSNHLDVRQTVITHLSDKGPHFVEILKSFIVILDRLGANTWAEESDEFPHVVFNTVKDNTSYTEILQGLPADKGRWAIQWMEMYVKTIASLPAFGTTVPLVIQYLCEELQHERYQDVRGSAIWVASRLFRIILTDPKALADTSSLSLSPVWESLDIHARIFVSVAFGRAYSGASWLEAREAARELVKAVLKNDVTNIHLAISSLSKAHSAGLAAKRAKQRPADQSLPTIYSLQPIRTQIWRKTYESIQPNDSYGITTVLDTMVLISHVDDLNVEAFEAVFSDKRLQEFKEVIHDVNSALGTIRSGFEDALFRYLDFANSGAVLELLSQQVTAKKIVIMMFSPLNSIRQPVQALVGLAMDVESRLDCFRALLLNFPEASLNGMFEFLEKFIKFAPRAPEACSLSKSLALCFTDVIDALCSNPDGLLHKVSFLQAMGEPGPAVQLPKWWALMSEALSIIFRFTVGWANYCDTQDMITWMRDALIFGRDMLSQRRVIESSALALSPQSSKAQSISHMGSKMVRNLQGVLFQLTGWLKLTDEELLYQAFSLVQSLLGCFKETQVEPAADAMAKLTRYANASQAEQKHRLDKSRVNVLRDLLASFTEEEDDEVEIIEHVIQERDVPAKKAKAESTKEKVRQKQQTLTSMVSKSKESERKAPPPKLKKDLTVAERRKLDAASVLPKFSRAATIAPQPVASSSKPKTAIPVRPQLPPPSSDASESSSSEDEGAAALVALAKKHAAPKRPEERRQVKMLDAPMTGKYQRILQQRNNGIDEARRMALRLKPDISSLHRRLLSWNYDHEGPHPPGESLKLYTVPDRFESSRHFRETFEPLLLLECWAQIQQSKEADEAKFECRIVGRQYADYWIDMDIAFTESVTKDWGLTETDIVLLRHPHTRHCRLLKVQHFKQAPNGLLATLRMVATPSDPGPQVDSLWQLSKVFSLTTLHREYGALVALEYYDMVRTILNPVLQKITSPDQSELPRLMQMYKLNKPQATAILNALEADGFSLIQGPPGTGKTSTICGLVQLFLSRRKGPATFITVGQNSAPLQKEAPKKILLCAPSNAAIDEITFRLKEGASGPGQRTLPVKVVRVGNPKAMNASVKDVSLDSLTEQKLNSNSDGKSTAKDSGNEMSRLRTELDSTKKLRQQKEEEMSQIRDNTAKTMALDSEIQALRQKVRGLATQLDKLRDQQKGNQRTMDALSRRCRAEVLQEADVICATLAGSGHEILETLDFEMVIIDEAAQAIELSSLIPLKYRCNRCVMVGDPQQLPPTVISQEASKYGYNQSLFVRLQKHRPEAVHLLSIQYRMHPEISILPSRLFYNGRLQDGPDMSSKTQRPWHRSPKFGPYHFYNVAKGVEETGRFHSLINKAEAQVAVALYNRLRQEFSTFDFDFKVGIVTMYRAQVTELRRTFEQRFGVNITSTVDFNTVDGFQGQEKDIIILSCVRAGPGLSTVGFLADVRRMNVALTRAKASVFILGNAATLERSDQNWKAIVQDARDRAALIDADVSFFTTPVNTYNSQKAAKIPNKASGVKPPTSALPLAEDLVALGRNSSAKGVIPPSRTNDTNDNTMDILPSSIPPSNPPMEIGNVTIGHKRPADDSLQPPLPPAMRAQQIQPTQHGARLPKKPKQPIVPKPKPPRSIFINRNPHKPPPYGGSAGPSRS